jgi:4-alpha-glucanotransferase
METMKLQRSSGILMHISSLPAKFGIGDLGSEAYHWVDFLDKTGTKYWQILPLNPTGYGNSPYQGLSAFAGNPLFIDLDNLQELGLLDTNCLTNAPNFSKEKVQFDKVIKWKRSLLNDAYISFTQKSTPRLSREFAAFKEKNWFWLDDFSIFMALREEYQLVSWSEWPRSLRMREPDAINSYTKNNIQNIDLHAFFQFIFFRQWKRLKEYANQKGIYIIGDIPIFMGFDCSDVWAYPHLFLLDEHRQPTSVAGVPPDFFSKTGQLWGNPLYDWGKHKSENYAWWIKRIGETLKTVDLIRLDHFRGFAGFFKIPAGSKTAENGEWVKGPGQSIFDSMEKELGKLPFIAEDLGVITPDVIKLREIYGFPGMRIFQFAFWKNADAEFLPHNYPQNCVAYTGTHDNDTSKGWFINAPMHEKRFFLSYIGNHTENIAHEMIRTVWSSVAVLAIAPMQDFLQLDSKARMNLPSSTSDNWEWRMRPDAITENLVEWIRKLNITFNREISSKGWKAKKYFQDNHIN